MGAVGTSADNALAESFNATLKREVLQNETVGPMERPSRDRDDISPTATDREISCPSAGRRHVRRQGGWHVRWHLSAILRGPWGKR
jgi:transposase InsO family protein